MALRLINSPDPNPERLKATDRVLHRLNPDRRGTIREVLRSGYAVVLWDDQHFAAQAALTNLLRDAGRPMTPERWKRHMTLSRTDRAYDIAAYWASCGRLVEAMSMWSVARELSFDDILPTLGTCT